MKRIMNSNKLLILSIIFIFVVSINNCGSNGSSSGGSKDLIVVLDTSLSMVGYGGKNILSRVKKSLSGFINQLNDGDSFTFITFDTTVKTYPTVYIDNNNDKTIISKYLSLIEAKGAWTYTMEMVDRVLKEAQTLENKDKDRQRVIVILTDALDDPPPGKRKNRLLIKDVAGAYKGKDWFIYFINLGDLKKNKGLIQLQKELKQVSGFTKIIDAEKSLEKSIQEDLKASVDKMIVEKSKIIEHSDDKDTKDTEDTEGASTSFAKFWSSVLLPLLLFLIIAGIIVFLVFFFKRLFEVAVIGRLEYWDHTVIEPNIRIFDMSAFNIREIKVGRSIDCQLKISDIDISKPFAIKAVGKQGEGRCIVVVEGDYEIEFVNKDASATLENNDIFRIANYSFKYLAK
ncbi:MAG: VWA domain-containing protein [Spirochaetota bacterium]|nr:VWA domain-containing protein [Spirochaetota bacterium]